MKKFISSIAASCLAVTALAYCKPASAEQIPSPSGQWVPVVRDFNSTIYQIDRGIHRQGQFAAFWAQSHELNGGRRAAYLAANCDNKAYQNLTEFKLDSAGNIISRDEDKKAVAYARNGTPIADLINAACGNQSIDPAVQAQANQAQVTQAQLEALSRARQTAQEGISNAMNSTARIFK